MDISRNVARTTLARSANWRAIRALYAQARPSIASRCATPAIPPRNFTSTSSSPREAQNQEAAAGIESNSAEPYSTPIFSSDAYNRVLTFRPRVDHANTKAPDRNADISVFHEFDPDAPADGSNVPIRERMRRFERDALNSAQTVMPIIVPGVQGPNTAMSLDLDTGLIVDEEDGFSMDQRLPAFEDGALVDFGINRSFLLPGDLVEFRTSGNRIEIAIFVRQLETQSQFYTMSGQWVHRQAATARFFVPHFVSPKDLEPLMEYLPDKSVPEADQDKIQKFENALPRSVGGPLIIKMRDFQKEADKIYRDNAATLDGAYEALSQPQEPRKVSLTAALRMLLKDKYSNRDSPQATLQYQAALYATYRALMNIDAGVKLVHGGNVRAWGTFEIVPRNIRDTINVTVNIVRLWQKQHPHQRVNSTFGKFILKAQDAIDRSRKSRTPTIYGQVGPAKGIRVPNLKVKRNHFNAHDLIFIRFIQCWVGWQSFHAGSSIASTGSAILRAIGRYDEGSLNQSTGWILLQELGYITPWDIPILYRMRLDGKRFQDSFKDGQTSSKRRPLSYRTEVKDILANSWDAVADLRLDWKDLRTFCIDEPSAHEIDDGVSVTRTSTEGECWVHVHVADPASMIPYSSAISKVAAEQMASTYLPDRVDTMLPDQVVLEKLSLAPGRPTLTFSAKLNAQGEMLDHRITPGIVNQVVYVSPATAAVVCGHSGESTIETILQVGDALVNLESVQGASRHMSSLEELDQSARDDLKLLASLGAARRMRNLLRGGVTLDYLNMEVAVKIPAGRAEEDSIMSIKHFLTDPSISVNRKSPIKEGDISPLMLLAGEVAAKWCKDRNIPVIYRVSQMRPGAVDPSAFFKKNILPYHLRDEDVPNTLLKEYLQSVGSILPSAIPGPHVQLGVDGFTRCTSPLRRYSDMVTHWQIQAALLHEAKTGTSLVGSKDISYLPFSKKDIDFLIPKQNEADYNAGVTSHHSNRIWTLQALLRAWKFGEAKTKLPETFKFSIDKVNSRGTVGAIEELGLTAQLQPEFLNGPQDITAGDVLEVELSSVNPYSGIVWVQALRKLEVEETEKVGRATKYL